MEAGLAATETAETELLLFPLPNLRVPKPVFFPSCLEVAVTVMVSLPEAGADDGAV